MIDTKNVRVFKLITSEEIIGAVYQVDEFLEFSDDELFDYDYENSIFVANPMEIISEYKSDKDAYEIKLRDWFPTTSTSLIHINKEQILATGIPYESVLDRYYQIMIMDSLDSNSDDTEMQ